MSSQGIWSVLGIEPTQDLSVIKRAYARQLKNTRPDQDPEGYQRLREAFDAAKHQGNNTVLSDVVTDEMPPAEVPASPFLPRPAPFEPVNEISQETYRDTALRRKVISQAAKITDEMMENETAGLEHLDAFIKSNVLQNIELHELFSQELAEQLSDRDGLYSALLINVSGIMGWDIDHYQPEGISAYRLAALQRQVEMTDAKRYWSVMVREYQDCALNRLRLRLLTVEGATVPWWAKLVPDFMTSLSNKLREIRMYHPALLPYLNSVLLKTLSETRVALSWGAVFLNGFWLLLIMLTTREHSEPWRSRILLIAIIGLYIHGYSYLERKLRYRPRMLCVTECVLSVLSTAIMVKIMLGFFTMFKPDAGNLVMAATHYGVLSASSFCVLWMMSPKHWKWYGVPLNAMIVLAMLPWQLMRKSAGMVSVVAFIALLGVYSLLIAFGFR
ncbi:hypothetical protein [Rahnella aquatilis]|uniref:hypothetical protein n=1 Tax=Rahnella aquatilis TaxID=34038 RepID=UPI00364B61D3